MAQRSDPDGRPEVGARVRYAVAGRAMREAGKRFARASARDAEDRITVADAAVLVTVTVSSGAIRGSRIEWRSRSSPTRLASPPGRRVAAWRGSPDTRSSRTSLGEEPGTWA